MQIKTIALIGAGAIGAYFISCLTPKLKENFWVVAEGERKARLEAEGIIINGEKYTLNVKTPEEAKGADLVVVGVKYNGLASVLPMLKTIVTEQTLVLSPMNGVDSESIIGEAIGSEHVMHSFMFISSERNGNEINFRLGKGTGLNVGEVDGKPSARTEALSEVFAGTDFHCTIKEHILKDIWSKYTLNISRNLPQAIINVGQGAYADSEHIAYISNRMRDEVVMVAAAKGIDISDQASDKVKPYKVAPEARYSTLQDLDAKRQTEIEMFSGTLIRMAKELGLAVPFNEFAYHAIKSLEEKNAGLIK